MENKSKTGTESTINNRDKLVNLGLSLVGQRRPSMLEARPFTVAGGCSTINRGKEPLILSAGPSPSSPPQGPSRAVDSETNSPPPSRAVHQIRERQGRGNGVNPPRSLDVRTQPVQIQPRIGEFRPSISVTYAKRLARRMPRTRCSNRRPAAPKRQLNPVGSLSYEPLSAGLVAAGAVAQRQFRRIRLDNERQQAVVGTEYHNLLGSNYSLSGYDRRPAPGIIFQYPNPALPAYNELLDAVDSPSAGGPMIQDGQPSSSSGNTAPQNRPASGSPGNPIVVDEVVNAETELEHRAGKEPVEGSSARPLDVETTNPMNRVNLSSGEGTSNMKLLETMWSARAVGDDGRVVKGFVFKNSQGDQVRIVCTCHGLFHSPEEFLGHAGASDLSDPFKSITVSPFQI